jgi:hypothetical protein
MGPLSLTAMLRSQPFAHFLLGKKMCGKRWGLFFSAFFTAHLFAGPSPDFLKTTWIKYWANLPHRHVTFTAIR